VIKHGDSIEIVLCDQGNGFDINKCDDPTKEENLSKPCGRGVFLIKNLMDEVSYNRDDNCLHMIKRIKRNSKSIGG